MIKILIISAIACFINCSMLFTQEEAFDNSVHSYDCSDTPQIRVSVGMEADTVLKYFGEPTDKNITIYSGGSWSQWIYEYRNKDNPCENSFMGYIYIDSGDTVVAYQ